MMYCDADLLLSDNNGTNMPRKFVVQCTAMVVDYDKWKDCLTFLAEHRIWDTGYWDTWDKVVAECMVMWEGHKYTLHQDGDLFMIPYKGEVTWVPDDEEEPDEPDDMYAWWFLNQIDRDVHKGDYMWRNE